MNKKYFLKSNTYFCPTIWKWYAWSHLINPISAAFNIVERHLKIMKSFIEMPDFHHEILQDPNMVGGPFLSLHPSKAYLIEDLINWTEKNCKRFINLYQDIIELNTRLKLHPRGQSLENLYQTLPSSLQGMVELVYDTNNNINIRFIEALFYKEYSTKSFQQMEVQTLNQDKRPFVLSTPLVDNNTKNIVYLNYNFSDNNIDKISKLRYEPSTLQNIMTLFNTDEDKLLEFLVLTSNITPQIVRKIDKGIVRISYFGHACVLLETATTSIIIDPLISYYMKDNNRFSLMDLPDKIDYVLITHNHQDHINLETLLQLRHKIDKIVVPKGNKGDIIDLSLKMVLQDCGFKNILELDEFENIDFVEGRISGIPFLGEHADLNIQTKLAYFIEVLGHKIIFAVDSNNLDNNLYNKIRDYYGKIDILFIGMECEGAPLSWLYGPLLLSPINREHDKGRALSGSNSLKAWSIVKTLECSKAFVYAMGMEPWLSHIMGLNYTNNSPQIIESDKFIQLCRQHNIESERLFGKKKLILKSK